MLLDFDVVVIGGGATGLGVAVEAASRGYRTVIFEANDFGSGTSSKSTKLVHGGIRYLANLDLKLIKEGLSERSYFLSNAPHIAQKQTYLIPFASIWDRLKYCLGVFFYDLLAGNKKIGRSTILTQKQSNIICPTIKSELIKGGIVYYDGQFDDTRMLITLLRTFLTCGGTAYNYHQVTGFIKDEKQQVCGVNITNNLDGSQFLVKAKAIINATGVLTDTLLDIDEPKVKHKHIVPSQGTHLVFDKTIYNCNHALVIPQTIDGRVLFVLPWHDKIIVGTTDIVVESTTLEPIAQNEEINFILNTLNTYLNIPVSRDDIRSIFTGLRPLVKLSNNQYSAKISRRHEIICSNSGIISTVGGKWTIYRLMGEDTINFAINKGLLHTTESISRNMHLFGYSKDNTGYPLNVYGSDVDKIHQIQTLSNDFSKIHPELPYYSAEIVYQTRYEMAQTVEDILARRTRALFLNARASVEAAPVVAAIMAKELHKEDAWVKQQITTFTTYAKSYIA